MKTLIKLVLAALVLHAAWRVGAAYWSFYQYQDALQEAAQFAFKQSESELGQRAVAIATDMKLPVQAEDVQVRKTQSEVFIDAAYVDQIQVLPGYPYPWRFAAKVHAWLRP